MTGTADQRPPSTAHGEAPAAQSNEARSVRPQVAVSDAVRAAGVEVEEELVVTDLLADLAASRPGTSAVAEFGKWVRSGVPASSGTNAQVGAVTRAERCLHAGLEYRFPAPDVLWRRVCHHTARRDYARSPR